jgi:primosomal protein N' (replication factor Y)
LPAVQALVRWDPAGYAARELADRSELGFPPAVRMAALTGAPEAVSDLLGRASLPAAAEVIGPVAAGTDSERTLIRVPRPLGTELATALKLAASARSLRRSGSAVKLELDPFEVL